MNPSWMFVLGTLAFFYGSVIVIASSGEQECFDKDGAKYCRNRKNRCINSFFFREKCHRTCGICTVPPGAEEIHPYQYTSTLKDRDMALFHHTVKTFIVQSIGGCLDECSTSAERNSDCRSINLKIDEAGGRICELNNGTKEEYPELFKKRPGFIYYEQSR